MNLEPWGKIHVSPPCLFCSFSIVSSNHHLHFSIDQLEHLFDDRETTTPHCHSPHASTLSTMRLLDRGWPVHYPNRELFIFSRLSGVKRNHDSLFEGSVLLFLTDCWPTNRFILLILTDCYLAVGSSFLMGLLFCSWVHPQIHAYFCVFIHHHHTYVTIFLLYC